MRRFDFPACQGELDEAPERSDDGLPVAVCPGDLFRDCQAFRKVSECLSLVLLRECDESQAEELPVYLASDTERPRDCKRLFAVAARCLILLLPPRNGREVPEQKQLSSLVVDDPMRRQRLFQDAARGSIVSLSARQPSKTSQR